MIIVGPVDSFRGLDGISVGSIGAIQDMLVMGEPVPTSSVIVSCLAREKSRRGNDSLAEKVGKTSKLGSVSRGVIVKLVDRDSVEFHVGWYSEFLWTVSSSFR